jgi:hypothetical protein
MVGQMSALLLNNRVEIHNHPRILGTGIELLCLACVRGLFLIRHPLNILCTISNFTQ